MAPKYRVTYFDMMGAAEPIRFMLSYGGADFEDMRLKVEEWPKVKPSTPFGKLPMLEVDGKKFHQSVAICRYLGKQFGICGKDSWEAMQIDIVVDTIGDMKTQLSGFHHETDQEAKAKRREAILKETVPFYFTKFEEMINNNGGFFVGGKLSWADLYLSGLADSFNFVLGSDATKDFPVLKAHNEKIRNLPSIKAWINKRPKSDM